MSAEEAAKQVIKDQGLDPDGLAIFQQSQMLRDRFFQGLGVKDTMARLIALLNSFITFLSDEKCDPKGDICYPEFTVEDYKLTQAVMLYLGCSAILMLEFDSPAANIMFWSPRQAKTEREAHRLFSALMGQDMDFRLNPNIISLGFARTTLLPLIRVYQSADQAGAREKYVEEITSMLERVALLDPTRVKHEENILAPHTPRYQTFEVEMDRIAKDYDSKHFQEIADALAESGSISTSTMLRVGVYALGLLAAGTALGSAGTGSSSSSWGGPWTLEAGPWTAQVGPWTAEGVGPL